MAENYKLLYGQMKKIVEIYQDMMVPSMREKIEDLEQNQIPVRCKNCKHWCHMESGMGDCTNGRFHLDGHADPTMKADDFCSCGAKMDGGNEDA